MMQQFDDETYAAQLRHPEGPIAKAVFAQMQQRNSRLYAICFGKIAHNTTLRMLEIGPGDAFWPATYLPDFTDIQYTGLDYAAASIPAAEQNLLPIQSRAKMIHGDLLSTALPPHSFHLILSINTLYFFDTLEPYFRRMHSLLASGGQVLLGYKPKCEMQQLPFTRYGFTLHNENAVSEALQRSGFHQITTELFDDETRLNGRELINMHAIVTCATAIP
jgi:SAM-dependent methyltransferase